MIYRTLFKRPLDFSCALALLVACSPVMLLCAFAIKLHSPGPVFFRQRRLGRAGSPFTLTKFRSMEDREHPLSERPGRSDGVTRVGAFLRRTKLDELPQLWEVLNGHMSLIGPRPAPVDAEVQRSPRAQLRLAVRPGMTGLAQVHGNSFLSWDERLEFDIRYIERLSFRLDCAIVLRTVLVMLWGERIFHSPPPAPSTRGDRS